MNKLAVAELITGDINNYKAQPFSESPYVATYMPSKDSIIVRDRNSKVLGTFELNSMPWKDQAADILFELKQLES